MVASIQFHAQGAADDYYLAQAREDYYTAGGEPPGKWFGTGAKHLDLTGPVAAPEFKATLKGLHPVTGKPLVRKIGAKHRLLDQPDSFDGKRLQTLKPLAAVDVCMSWRKEHSALYILSDAATRKIMNEAAHEALRNVLGILEKEVPLARFGRGGREKQHAELVVSIFDHATNRNGQIQKHHHCVIANACRREDGTWGRLNTKPLRSYVRTLGPLWQSEFAALLRERVGIGLIRGPQGKELVEGKPPSPLRSEYKLPGIPQSLVDAWSSRRREILDQLAGGPAFSSSTSAAARAKAAVETRGAKSMTRPFAELQAKAIAEAAQHGVTPQAVKALLGKFKKPNLEKAYAKALDRAIERLTQTEAHFTLRQATAAVAEELLATGMRATELMKRVTHDLFHDPRFKPLAIQDGELRYTTRANWQLERKLFDVLKRLSERKGPKIRKAIIKKTLDRYPELSAEQRSAAQKLLTQKGEVKLLTGVAGSGKSQTMKPIKEVLEASGYKCLGAAMAGAAAEELSAKTGMHARTVASLLYQLDKEKQLFRPRQAPLLDRKTVLVIDEIGMLDTKTMQRLLKHVHRCGAKLIGLGDSRQLSPILAGAPLERMKRVIGGAHLVKNQRQKDRSDQLASALLRRGSTESMLKVYGDRGKLIVSRNKEESAKALVRAWADAGGAIRPKDHLVFAQTRTEAKALNRLCQSERLQSQRRPNLKSVNFEGERFMTGDRVLFHQRLRAQGVQNGHQGTILSVSPLLNRITVRLDHAPLKPNSTPNAKATRMSQTVVIPLRSLRKEGLSLGYAATTHSMQGKSVPYAYALVGGSMTNREMSYTQMSRGQLQTRLFVAEADAGEKNADLAKSMKQSVRRGLAHDVIDHAHKQARLLEKRTGKVSPEPNLKEFALTKTEREFYSKFCQRQRTLELTTSVSPASKPISRPMAETVDRPTIQIER